MSRLVVDDFDGRLRFGAVIFDMDGVLVDSEPLHDEADRRLLARHGVRHTASEDDDFFGFTEVELLRAFKDRYRIAADVTDLARERTALLIEILRAKATPMPGVPDVLVELRALGCRLALASSSSHELIAATLGILGVRPFFEVVVSSAEVGRGKPAPDVFLETARRLAMPPRRCLVIEDSRNGVLAARAAGAACVALPCPATRGQDLTPADFRCASLREVPALVAGSSAPLREPRD